MFLNYNSLSMWSSSESLGSMRLLSVFASSALLFMISKELLLRYSAFDSRFYCSFNISKPLAQGWPFLKQWIKWSSLPSVLKFNPQLLNDLMIRFFSSHPKIPKSTRLPNDRFHIFYFSVLMYTYANYSS